MREKNIQKSTLAISRLVSTEQEYPTSIKEKGLSCKLKNRKSSCSIQNAPVLPVNANNSSSNSESRFHAPCPPHLFPVECEEEQGHCRDSISCEPAEEPLLRVMSSLRLYTQPRGLQRLLGSREKNGIITDNTIRDRRKLVQNAKGQNSR